MTQAINREQILKEFQFQLVAEPPRLPVNRTIGEDHELLWTTVIDWVDSHREIITRITGKVRRYFPGSSSDIYNMALLVAFESLRKCVVGGELENFVSQFCGMFRNNFLDLCKNVPIDFAINVEKQADPEATFPYLPGTSWPQRLNAASKEKAFSLMTSKQRYAWQCYLDEWNSCLSSQENLALFGFKKSNFYAVLGTGISRVAQRVREEGGCCYERR